VHQGPAANSTATMTATAMHHAKEPAVVMVHTV
jgi:hypothetical protein